MIDRNASENTKLVGARINKRQQIFFVSKPIWQAPRSNMQRCWRVLDNFHLNHEVLLKTPFRVWTLYFFRPADGFLLVLPTTVSLAIFFQTGGLFCSDNRPLFPSLRCSEGDMHNCVLSKNCYRNTTRYYRSTTHYYRNTTQYYLNTKKCIHAVSYFITPIPFRSS